MRKEESLAVGGACKLTSQPTLSLRQENLCELWVLSTGDLDFGVPSTQPLAVDWAQSPN